MIVVDPRDPAAQPLVVAYGILTKSHSGMDGSRSGDPLCYLSGTDLMVSDSRSRPSVLRHGIVGFDWA